MLDDAGDEFYGNQSLFNMGWQVAKQVQHVEFNDVGWHLVGVPY